MIPEFSGEVVIELDLLQISLRELVVGLLANIFPFPIGTSFFNLKYRPSLQNGSDQLFVYRRIDRCVYSVTIS